ncbi:MAG: T9SS type A sorting domain-containing protein [Bacteroidia bacterium]|nr:T9SS type A sorting domain-containing protein [Bacteroidia bacterium]
MKKLYKMRMLTAAVLLLLSVNFIKAQALSASIISQTNATCFGSCDGSLIAAGSGGAGAYTYQWSQGATTAAISGLCAGVYTVTITDALAATATVSATILQPSALTANVNSQSICSGSNIALCANVSGGTPAYTFNWAPSSGLSATMLSCPTASPATTTSYTLTVTDQNGCSFNASATVTVTPLPTVFVVSHAEPSCSGSNGSITFSSMGGNAPYLYDIPGQGTNTTGIYNSLATGTYNLGATDASGCVGSLAFLLLDSCEVVWPGDADNDLTANNFDILDIGLYYGGSAYPRPAASNVWVGQPSQNTSSTKPNGYNTKHDDCNGDGTIDAADTTAVIQNYNFIHPPYKLMMNTMSGVEIYTEFIVDTISNSNHAVMKVKLGTAANPATNIYGVALTLSFDTTIVAKDSATFNVSNSWLAAGSPVFLSNKIENYVNGEFDIALCRTNQTNVSGNGEIAELDITMKDDISGKVMSNFAKVLHINISKVKIIDATGDTVSYSASGDSLVVEQLSTAISNPAGSSFIKLFPNPAKEFVAVHSTTNDLMGMEIYSLQGKKIDEIKNEQASSEIILSTKNIESGIYLLKVHTLTGTKMVRVQVQ